MGRQKTVNEAFRQTLETMDRAPSRQGPQNGLQTGWVANRRGMAEKGGYFIYIEATS